MRVRAMNRRHGPLWVAAVAITAGALIFAAWEAAIVVPLAFSHDYTIGLDLHVYLDRARDWLAGDGFYQARQLAGPYVILPGDALYPPPILYFLIPMLALPEVVWWSPVIVVAYAIWWHRPVVWTWPVLALILCLPRAWEDLLYGNPVLWATGAIAAGTIWGWPYVGAFLKPTIAIFAFLGVRKRSWWIALGLCALLSLPFGVLWVDYVHTLTNAQNGFGADYLFGELPIAMAPVIAWAGRTRRSAPKAAQGQPLAA
jgi:hypothetical protein